MPLTSQNIESELSYAYLHAVAANAGMSCKLGDRHDDGAGVDAEVIYRGPTPHKYLKQIQLNVQIKATVGESGEDSDFASYFISDTKRYDKLRTNDSHNYKILVVLYLPRDTKDWLTCSVDELIIKHSAYWTCLYGAVESKNVSGQTVYLPRINLLTVKSITELVMQAATTSVPKYNNPKL